MELTRTDVVFSRTATVLFLCRIKSSRNRLKINGELFQKIYKISARRSSPGGPHPVHEGGGAPPASWAPLMLHRCTPRSYIFRFGEKKIRGKELSRFTRRSRRQALISLGRADLESVRGSEEWRSSSSTFLYHQFNDAHRRV